jgi:uncharacterized membrane protein YqjE
VANDVHEKPSATVVADLKAEAKQFASTRLEMLRTEVKDKVAAVKIAVPAILGGLLFAWVAFLCLTGALVSLVAKLLGGSVGMVALSFAIVGVVYLLIAAAAAMFGVKQLRSKGLAPKHTLRVLKQDQAWIRTETKKAA